MVLIQRFRSLILVLVVSMAGLGFTLLRTDSKSGKSPFKKIQAQETVEGDGARVKRLFPTKKFKNLDPFVLLDEFFVTPPAGFPMHAHRGFEAITYMIDGSFRHEDTLGNKSTVEAGGAQRFTAGRGIMHSEMPGGDKVSHGLQLWINLSADKKQIPASYQQVNPGRFLEMKTKDKMIRYIVGNGTPLEVNTDMIYYDITLHEKKYHSQKLDPLHNGFIYCLSGEIVVEEETITSGEALFFEKVSKANIKANKESRFVIISGKPHNQPIKHRGPFVD